MISSSGGGGLSVVLLMPCHGRFICLFSVPGAGGRYLLINFVLRLGAPFSSPCLSALRMVRCLGLNMLWCANCTAFLLLVIE